MEKGIRENIIKTYQNLIDSNLNPKVVQPVLTEQITSKIAEAAKQGGGGGAVGDSFRLTYPVEIKMGTHFINTDVITSAIDKEDILNAVISDKIEIEFNDKDTFPFILYGQYSEQTDKTIVNITIQKSGYIASWATMISSSSEINGKATIKQMLEQLKDFTIEVKGSSRFMITSAVIRNAVSGSFIYLLQFSEDELSSIFED